MKSSIRNFSSAALSLVAVLMLTACALGGENVRYRLIDPQVEAPDANDRTASERQLAIARPLTDQTRDSSRILVRRDRSLMPWAQAAWIDRAPDVVRGELIAYLDGDWGTVGRHGDLPAPHRIDLVLERFELVDGEGGLSAEVALTARLIGPQGALQAVLRPRATRAVQRADSLDSAVAAMEGALRSTFDELAQWLDAEVPERAADGR